ncbi:MAG: response regulator [Thermodesulfobacteriota bacterium]|nr:response regulator [Thermodesulfobacteriota bacterium]
MNGTRLLTIDDESYIRKSIRSFFEDYDFVVFEAENGRTGIEIFEREKPDIVILDLRMPEMGGLEVLEILREKSPDTPLIVASGTGNASAVVEALHLGAWDYILKPVHDMGVLLHSVKKCLNTNQLKKDNIKYQERLEELVMERTKELKASEEKYKAVFECTGSAKAILEHDMTISMANTKFASLVGLPVEKIEGIRKWTEFLMPEDLETMKALYEEKRNFKSGITDQVQHEFRVVKDNKAIRYIYVSIGIIPGTDKSIISLLDITEKIKAEERWNSLEKQLRKAQRMEAVGTLAGGIAHDLNNILSPILGYSDMIMREADPGGSVFRRSNKILKAACRAADLVKQIFSFSRADEEKTKAITIQPVVKEVVKLLHGSIPSTIEIIDKIDNNCCYVEADPTQIHQILMNLCTNSYHAMEETGGKLIISLKESEISEDSSLTDFPEIKKGNYLFLEVSDTGCGIEEGVQQRIFDPYFTTKEEGKGTGLGLAMVYSIVKNYSGEIIVNSSPGMGSVFTIVLPVVSNHERLETDGFIKKEFDTMSGAHILVVDDDREIADMLKEGLESLGCLVSVFYSGMDAFSYFTGHMDDIDMVLTDQTMPDKTGFDLAMEMLALKPDIPIILCSGYTGTINAEKVKKAGIKEFVMKPVSLDVLSDLIQKNLRENHKDSGKKNV